VQQQKIPVNSIDNRDLASLTYQLKNPTKTIFFFFSKYLLISYIMKKEREKK
jgi:hypothetical protein